MNKKTLPIQIGQKTLEAFQFKSHREENNLLPTRAQMNMFNYIKHAPATSKRNDQIVNEIQEHRNEEQQIKSNPKQVNEEKLKKLAKTSLITSKVF